MHEGPEQAGGGRAATARPMMPLAPGDPTWLGSYELLGRLGSGGMGTVYLGRGPGGRRVAVKAIRPEYAQLPEFRSQFRREATLARRVARFCTAEVIEVGDGDPPYLVTEYIAGPTLSQAVTDGGPLPPGDLERVAVSVAAALAAIHRAGLIHRDLKPSNVLLSDLGPRVIDFGIARAAEVTTTINLSLRSPGTPAFMSPEQADGTLVTEAADIFAWGGLVAFAGTGRLPFGDGTSHALLYRVVHHEPSLEGLDGPLLPLVRQAMSKDPADRPTADELLIMLVSLGTESHDPEVTQVSQSAARPGVLDPLPTPPAPPAPTPPPTPTPVPGRTPGPSPVTPPPGSRPAPTPPPSRVRRELSPAPRLNAAPAAGAGPDLITMLPPGGSTAAGSVPPPAEPPAAPTDGPTRPRRRPPGGRRGGILIAGGVIAAVLIGVTVPLVAFRGGGTPTDGATAARVAAQVDAAAGSLGANDPGLAARLNLAAYRIAPGPATAPGLLTSFAAPFSRAVVGHSSSVLAVAGTVDGRLGASGSSDGTVRLWNVAAAAGPTPLATLTGARGGWFAGLAFSPDGRLLASGNTDGTIRIWDVATPTHPTLAKEFSAHRGGVRRLVFSPDGRLLASGGADDATKLWDIADPTHPALVATLIGHTDEVMDVAFSPDGRTLAATSKDSTVELWNVSDPRRAVLVSVLTGHTDFVWSVAFRPDGRVLATAGYDGTVRFWNVTAPARARQIGIIAADRHNVYGVAFTADGRTVYTAGDDTSIHGWDVTDPTRPRRTTTLAIPDQIVPAINHLNWTQDLSLAGAPGRLLSGYDDGSLRVWDLDPVQLAGEACRAPDRRITRTEWDRYVPTLPYRAVC